MPNGVIQFDEFSLDCDRYELIRSGRRIKIEKIPMELLILLVDRRGHLVTRQEIIDHLWGHDVFLDTEHGINTAIRKVRAVLRDDPEAPRFVQTITGKGYRFVAPTVVLGEAPKNGGDGSQTPDVLPENPNVTPSNGNSSRTLRLATGSSPESPPRPNTTLGPKIFFAAFASIALISALLLGVRTWRGRLFSSSNPSIHSIAVLPLQNLSGDPSQDYFADGMTEELITMLAKQSGLRVVSRTSAMQFKKAQRSLPEIARQLNVDGIVEGSVSRSANNVHITVQLIYAPTDTHLWADSYDRDLKDLNTLQTELATTIAHEAGAKINDSAKPARQINPEAHDAYLRGRYYWFTDHLPDSQQYFQRAISLQPDYAAAWSGLADFYLVTSFDAPPKDLPGLFAQAEAAADKAVALDDSDATAHNSRAAVDLFVHWDPKRADQESQRAIQLDPSFAEAHHFRSKVLCALNRPEQAVEEEKQASALDPFARPWALIDILMRAHDFDTALEEGQARAHARPLDPDIHSMLAYAYFFTGKEPAAAEEEAKTYEVSGDQRSADAVRQAFQRAGYRGVIEWKLAKAKQGARGSYVPPLGLADLYVRLHRKEEALSCLERAYNEHSPRTVQILNDPSYDPLHSDPRFQALVKNMGLTQ